LVQRKGLASTVIAGLLFGTTVPTIKLGLALIPPESFVALRFTLASIFIIIFLRKQGWINREILRTRPLWALGLANAAGYVTQFQGQEFISSSNAALIISTAALMIPILSLGYGHERLGPVKISGVLTGFVGTVLVVTRGQALNLASSEFIGDILIVATAVTIALVFVWSKTLVAKFGGPAVTGGIIMTTSVLLWPTIPLDRNFSGYLTLQAWIYVVFLAIPATVCAYYFLMKGLETVSPTISSIVLPIEVIVAVLLSVIVFNDPFNFYSGTGAVLIIAGVILVPIAA
jgi:drug/metabolite transporter (DMT)-like permease